MSIKRVSARGKAKLGSSISSPSMLPDTRSGDRDATTSGCDLAPRRSGSARSPFWISIPTRPAKIFAVLRHHRTQNLLARVDAEIEERVLDVGEGSQQGERDLHGHRLGRIDGLEMIGILGMLGHGGGSFVVWLPPA
jgi:hypothetical protein